MFGSFECNKLIGLIPRENNYKFQMYSVYTWLTNSQSHYQCHVNIKKSIMMLLLNLVMETNASTWRKFLVDKKPMHKMSHDSIHANLYQMRRKNKAYALVQHS